MKLCNRVNLLKYVRFKNITENINPQISNANYRQERKYHACSKNLPKEQQDMIHLLDTEKYKIKNEINFSDIQEDIREDV